MLLKRYATWAFFLGIPVMVFIYFLEISTFVLGSGLYVIILFLMLILSKSKIEVALAGITATVFLISGVVFTIDNVALLSHDTFVISRILITIVIWIVIYFFLQYRKAQHSELKLHKQLNVLFNNSPEGIFILNMEGEINLMNPQACLLFGYSKNELLGKKIHVLLPERFAEKLEQRKSEYMTAFQNKEMGLGLEAIGKKIDGAEFPVYVSLNHFKTDEGQFVVAFVADMTERKKSVEKIHQLNEELEIRVDERTLELTNAVQQVETINENLQREIMVRELVEDELKKSRELYKAIARNFPDGWIGVLNEKLEYVLADGKGLKEYGFDAENIIGKRFTETTGAAEAEHWLTECLSGKTVTFDIHCACGICEVNAVPFMDLSGKEILIVVRNVTNRKKAEYELVKALEKERELGELKSRFVTMASHEFRTPLTTILSSAFLLENYTGEKLEIEKAVHTKKIKRAVNLLTEILNEFLSLGKLEEGNIKPVFAEINVNEFITEALKDIEPLKKTGQNICIHMEPDISIQSDKQFLRAIIYNLVSNACKYTHNDDEIVVDLSLQNNSVIIRVTDHGIGIPPEDQKYVFKRFYRAHNASNIQGTGLGLNIVKKYVRLLKGSIDFISEKNNTTFTVILPVTENVVTNEAVDTKFSNV